MQPYPGPGEIEIVSSGGGSQPVWANSGRELFYWARGPADTIRMMAVDVALGAPITLGRPRVLFEKMSVRYPAGPGGRAYDVARDGTRFLMLRQGDDASQPPITQINLVQNWFEELKRLVPTN